MIGDLPKSTIKICRSNRTVFQFNLLWPADGTELNPGFEFQVKIFFYLLLTGILLFVDTAHLILRYKTINKMDSEEVSLLIAGYGSYFMVFTFLKSQRKITLLLNDLSNFNSFGIPEDFHIVENRMNFCVKLFVVYSSLAIFLTAVLGFVTKEKCKEICIKEGSSSNHCGLIAPMWIPFRIDYFPLFHFFLLFGFVSAYLLIKQAFHISFNALEIGQHIIARINHLKQMIIICFDCDNFKERKIRLRRCILYHLEIIEFTQRLDEAFFSSMFGHFALTGLICACIEKQLIDGDNVYSGALHFVGWIFALFVGCIAGQQLLNASDIIPDAIWNSKWFEADCSLRKDLLFMLMRSQKQFKLRGGPFVKLSFPLFVSVLKTSYSILCVLTSHRD